MVLVLPTYPGPASATPRPITARNEMRPAFGGPITRNLRPGTRWAWDVVMPAMTYADSLEWDDLLSEDDTIRMAIPQPGFDVGFPGAPMIDGPNQAGRILNLKGLTPAYVVRKGQWLSFEVGGQVFAYKAAAQAVAGADGTCDLQLRTMLRASPANGAVVNLAEPIAEGFATVDPGSMEIDEDGFVRPAFTLEERE